MWKVNAGRRSVSASEFHTRGIVAIGWREGGDYSRAKTRLDVLEAVRQAYPDKTDQQHKVSAGQIWRFLDEMKIGDRVMTYDPETRLYHIGQVTGPPVFAPQAIDALPLQRSVRWSDVVSRDLLSQSAKGRLGAILTLFKVAPETVAEIDRLIDSPRESVVESITGEASDTPEVNDAFEGVEDQAIERIKDRILALGWDEMQDLVAALLRALGYRTLVASPGADRGRDIVASRDGFGFERPRIVVEVKHRRGAIGEPEVARFLAALHREDRGLFVSTGGFTQQAHYKAENAQTVVHLMTLDGLAQALIEQYEQIDAEGKRLLPLAKIYWPA